MAEQKGRTVKREGNGHAKPDNMPQRCPNNETFDIRS